MSIIQYAKSRALLCALLIGLPLATTGCEDSGPQVYRGGHSSNNAIIQCTNRFTPAAGLGDGLLNTAINYSSPLDSAIRVTQQIGRSSTSQECTSKSIHELPVGSEVRWDTATPMKHYIIKVLREFNHREQYCREYDVTAIDGKKRQQYYSAACLQSNGRWREFRR